MHIPLKNDFILLDRMHFRVSWICALHLPSQYSGRDPRVFPQWEILTDVQFILLWDVVTILREGGSLTFSPTSLRTKTDNEDRRKISVLAWQYDRLAPLMGYMAMTRRGGRGRGRGERKIKSALTARNFHKTIPRVLINLSCPSVQVVDCLRRNFSLSSPRSLCHDSRVPGATKMDSPLIVQLISALWIYSRKKINTLKSLLLN